MNNKLKVLLVHPEISRTKYNFAGIIENECLELEYISAMLKERDYDVTIFDVQVERTSVLDQIRRIKPDVVYICGRTKQENFILEYCEEAKKHNENIITIIGGLHAQLCHERMYRDYVDYILITFDIYRVLDIIDYHFTESSIALSDIEGICYRMNRRWIKNPSTAFDINKLPLPDRSYFYEHADHYRYLELQQAACVRTAYCCPYRCKFCIRNRMNEGKYVARDIQNVVDEIAEIQSDTIYFVDDDFLVSRKRIREFIRLIKEKNIQKKYICYGRSDFVANNEELMAELKGIGLYYVLVGLEATDDHQLDGYNKKSSVSNNIKTIEMCNRLGINIMGMFILGLDYTPSDFKSLYRWVKVHNLKHVAISIFTPEFGLETYDDYKDRMVTDNPSHWDYLHVVAQPSQMSVRRYYFHYYFLLIKLFVRGQSDGLYDFLDYGDYIRSFIRNIFRSKRNFDDE